MKSILIFINIILMCSSIQTCNAQLLQILERAENQTPNLNYVDKNNNYYQRTRLSGVDMSVVFTEAKFSNKKDIFLIEGRTITSSLYDTVGLCCIHIFLGQTKGDSIYNLRPLGKSNSEDENPKNKHGFFSFEIKILSGDRLFFCGDQGGGLKEYFVDRLLRIDKEIQSQPSPSQK